MARRGEQTPATVAATRAGIACSLHAYEYTAVRHAVHADEPRTMDDSYGEAVADALGVARDRVLKTLVADVDGKLTVAVLPVSASLDLKALAAITDGKRAAMAEPRHAERATGYVRGGISPLGQRRRLPTVVDASAGDHDTIFVSAGRRGLQIQLAPADLVRVTGASTATITRAR